jgi:chromate transporter
MTAPQAGCGDRPVGSAGSWPETLAVFLKLGLTSFGGPVAHLGYFRDEFVVRRRWLADQAYADLVALCQFLPGPASSQVGIAIGLTRAGWPGALAAWLGFTLPSALAMVLFAYGIDAFADDVAAGWLRGLKVVAVAVVANAVWGMARSLSADRERATLTGGRAGSVRPPTSRSRLRRCCSWPSGSCLPGWW